MALRIEIPDSVADAMLLPPAEREARVRVELAVALYAQQILGFGKARELAALSPLAFGRLLGDRGVARHYSADDVEADLAFAREAAHVDDDPGE